MYARSTTIQAQPTSVDAGITHMRDKVMPALEAIDGCVGLSLLVDRTSGRCIATNSWESEEAMRASAESLRPMRDRAAELFGGGGAQIEEWEIGAMHREHRAGEGACVRVTWVEVDPDQLDGGIEFYGDPLPPSRNWRDSVAPACSSTGAPAAEWPRRPSTTPKRLSRTRTSWRGSKPRQPGSKRRGTRPVRLRVGTRSPACARDGLTVSACWPTGRTSEPRWP